MLDLLRQFLVGNTTPEMLDAIADAYGIFERVNVDDVDFNLEDILMLEDVSDIGATMAKVRQYFIDTQHDILAGYGVTLAEDLNISDLTMFIRGILDIEDYENTEELVQITMGELRPEESFSEIMALMCHRNADELLDMIEQVDGSLIRRVQDVASGTDDELVDDEERLRRSQFVHMLKRFCHYINTKQLVIVNMIKDGIPVGFPYSVYADQIGRGFEGIIPEQVAKEMVAMALVSSDGLNNPLMVIKGSLENYVADLNVITKIDIEVNRLLQGFNRE